MKPTIKIHKIKYHEIPKRIFYIVTETKNKEFPYFYLQTTQKKGLELIKKSKPNKKIFLTTLETRIY